MAARTQGTPDYFVWEVPGKSVVVHLHLDVVDRMLSEVMRGFGAVPKRGAEVGGLLIGTIEKGDVSIVCIEDFEPVECSYKRGPSYLFSEEDLGTFDHAVQRWQPVLEKPAYAVGYYRSSTREGMSLAKEDVELMDEWFPSPTHVALIIKPYGTKVSIGGFFFREDGDFQDETPLEFPFRRREMTGEEPPLPRSLMERRPRRNRERGAARELIAPEPMDDYDSPEQMRQQPGPAYAVTLPSKSRLRSAVWIPLSFVFLVFGIALGMMISLTRGPSTSRGEMQDFSLGLAVSKSDENLNVKWDRQAPAIRFAQRGTIEIEDGGSTVSRELEVAELQNGSLVYRNSSNAVKFRLIVYPRTRISVVETVDWKN